MKVERLKSGGRSRRQAAGRPGGRNLRWPEKSISYSCFLHLPPAPVIPLLDVYATVNCDAARFHYHVIINQLLAKVPGSDFFNGTS